MNLFTLLEGSARRYPKRPAIWKGVQAALTYSELHHRALTLAHALRARAQPGDRVVIFSKNVPQYLEILFACWAAGLIAVPLNCKLHPREAAQIAADAGAAIIFAGSDLLAGETGAGPKDAPVITIGSAAYEAMLAGNRNDVAETRPDDVAWLFYTSGTTGRSKGAMLTHRNLMTMTTAYLADFDAVEPGHSWIHAAPMSHGSGLYALPYVARGASQVIPASAGYDPDEFVALCRAHGESAAFLAPTMVRRLCHTIEQSGVAPRGLRALIYGGGPMHLEDLRKAIALFGSVLVQLYGQGESPMTITGLRRADHVDAPTDVLASVGWARSGVEVRVVDASDRPTPPGEVGEIVCRGDVVMAGYWGDAEASAAALRGGWLHTGDLGALRQDGLLTLHDRSKDVIISGGSNIYPREVEDVLLAHPAVAEACVAGVEDAEWGEVVVAWLVVDRAVETSELDALCLDRIARFKRPKYYVFVDELPKNAYGKIIKRTLVAREKKAAA